MNQDNYIYAVLQKLNLSPTPNRLNFLRAWAMEENTTAQNNPLATTWDAEPWRNDKYLGGYWFNWNGGFPVKNYSSFDIGVQAFVNTIKQGYYSDILKQMQQNIPFPNWINVTDDFKSYGGNTYYNELSHVYQDHYGSGTNLAGFAGFALLLLFLSHRS